MADVDNGDILRIGATMLLQDIYEITNVFHAQVTSGGGLDYDDASDDVGEYMDDIYTLILPLMTSVQASYQLSLANITQDTTIGAFSWPNPLTGSTGGDFTAPGVCVLTWARTFKPRVQSRKYWGVFAESAIGLGTWSASVLEDCEAAHALHATSFVGTNGLTLLGVAYNRTLATITALQTIASASEPSYQRRRRRGRGS